MTNELQQLRERIRVFQTKLSLSARSLSGATYSIRETYRSLESNLSKAKHTADSTQHRVEQLRDDDLSNRVGRGSPHPRGNPAGKRRCEVQRAADNCLKIA